MLAQHYKPPDEPPSEYQTIPLSKIEDFGVHCKSYYSLDITFFKSSIDAGLLDLLWAKYWVNTLASSPLLSTRDLTAGQIKDIGAPHKYTSLPHCACPFCMMGARLFVRGFFCVPSQLSYLVCTPCSGCDIQGSASIILVVGCMRLFDTVPAKCAAEKLEACEGQVAHSGRMGRYTGAGAGDKKPSGADQQLHKICCDANKLALEHIKGVSSQVLACIVLFQDVQE